MTKFFTALVFALFATVATKAQDGDYFASYIPFEAGSAVYLYGDNVKFRDAPNTESNTIEQLPIGTPVEILAVMDEKMQYNGADHFWYKVKHNGKEGYILGGLLSLTKLTGGRKGDVDFYFIRRNHDDRGYVDIRAVRGNAIISEFSVLLKGSYSFSLSISDNRGLAEVDNILTIDYIAEACGVDGGLTYVWWRYDRFYHLADLSEVGDGGVFYTTETFTFPKDKDGMPNVVIYNRETVETFDENTNWTNTTIERREYKWGRDGFIPKFHKDE